MTSSNKKRFYIEVGLAIQEARKKANLSQAIVAQKINMSRASIVNIEKGRQNPPLHLLWSFSQILNTSIHDLIPDFQSENEEIISTFDRMIKMTAEKGHINEESSKKLTSFIIQD